MPWWGWLLVLGAGWLGAFVGVAVTVIFQAQRELPEFADDSTEEPSLRLVR